MGERTGIEWTNATWNPWRGCRKISPGCAHCYMFREQERYGNNPFVVVRSKTTFTAPLTWSKPRLVFTCSWSDFFIEEADAWRDEAWEIIRSTPQHTYQILTKRPENIASRLPTSWPMPNVWLGVSIENAVFLGRADVLRKTPAALRFLSLEPLLGYLGELDLDGIGWVIVGGESGPGWRQMNLDWARNIRDACAVAQVPFFLKQLGGWPDKRGGDKAVLDGRTWTEMPACAS